MHFSCTPSTPIPQMSHSAELLSLEEVQKEIALRHLDQLKHLELREDPLPPITTPDRTIELSIGLLKRWTEDNIDVIKATVSNRELRRVRASDE